MRKFLHVSQQPCGTVYALRVCPQAALRLYAAAFPKLDINQLAALLYSCKPGTCIYLNTDDQLVVGAALTD